MALILGGGSFFLDGLSDDSIFANDGSTMGKLAVETFKEVDAEYTRTVKSLSSVNVATSRATSSEAPKGRKLRFLIKHTRHASKWDAKDGKQKRNYCTIIGAEDPTGLSVGPISMEKVLDFSPLGPGGFEFLSNPENHNTRLFKSIQMWYALYADWKAAIEKDDQAALHSHPKLLMDSPHFQTSRYIPQMVRDHVVLACVPQYAPPAKEGAKRIPAISPRDYAAFIENALNDEMLIADICQTIYAMNVERGAEIYQPGDCFAASVPKDHDPRDGRLRMVPKAACGIATGYIARVALVSPNTGVYKGVYTEKPGVKVSYFWKHDEIMMWKMLLEIPPREVFNFQIEARDFSHSLRFTKKYDQFHIAVLPLRSRAFLRWSSMFLQQLAGKGDEEQLEIRSHQRIGFATFGPYLHNESNYKRATFNGKAKSQADREKSKAAKESIKNIHTVGSYNPNASSTSTQAVSKPTTSTGDDKKAPVGVYFDWYLMHLEIDQGPLLYDVPDTNYTDVNVNVFSTYVQVNFADSALRSLGIGSNDYKAAEAIVQPLLYTANISIETGLDEWEVAVGKSEKMCDELIRNRGQVEHEAAWQQIVSGFKAAHVGSPAMAARGIYRVDRTEHAAALKAYLVLAMDFNRADKVVTLEKIDNVVMDVAAAISQAGWMVRKSVAVELEQSVSERLINDASPVAHFKFGMGIEMVDGIQLINSRFCKGVSNTSGISEDMFDFYVVGFEKPFKPRTGAVRSYSMAETDVIFSKGYYNACRMGADDKEAYIQEKKAANPGLRLTASSAPDLSEGPCTTFFALYAIPKSKESIITTAKFRELTTGTNEVKSEEKDAAVNNNNNNKKRKREEDVKAEPNANSGDDAMDTTEIPLPGEVPPELKNSKIEEMSDTAGW